MKEKKKKKLTSVVVGDSHRRRRDVWTAMNSNLGHVIRLGWLNSFRSHSFTTTDLNHNHTDFNHNNHNDNDANKWVQTTPDVSFGP